MGSGRNRRFGVVPFFLPDIALSSVPSGADTTLFACHRTIGRVSAASGGSGTSVRRFPHSILLLRRGGPAIMAVVLLLWGVVVFRLLVPYMGRWAWIPTVLAVAWEAGRQCGLSYPLSGTIALTGYRRCFVVVS